MYYAFSYADGKNTTSGQPNNKTGRLNIAGHLTAFTGKSDRDEFVQRTGADPVTAKQARELHLGMSLSEYREHLGMICDHELRG